jgi:hypothetical protein
MEFKGTKGKWEIYGISDEIMELYSAETQKPIFDIIPHTNKKELNANCLLVSKAPELLEALKHTLEILYQCECPKELYETYGNLFANYNNLIKEATTL